MKNKEFDTIFRNTLFGLMSAFYLLSLFFIQTSRAESSLKEAEGELNRLGFRNHTAYADGMEIAIREECSSLRIIADNSFFIIQVAKIIIGILGTEAERGLCLFLNSAGMIKEKITRNRGNVYELGYYYENSIALSDSLFEIARYAKDPAFPRKVFMHELWHAAHGRLNPKALPCESEKMCLSLTNAINAGVDRISHVVFLLKNKNNLSKSEFIFLRDTLKLLDNYRPELKMIHPEKIEGDTVRRIQKRGPLTIEKGVFDSDSTLPVTVRDCVRLFSKEMVCFGYTGETPYPESNEEKLLTLYYDLMSMFSQVKESYEEDNYLQEVDARIAEIPDEIRAHFFGEREAYHQERFEKVIGKLGC